MYCIQIFSGAIQCIDCGNRGCLSEEERTGASRASSSVDRNKIRFRMILENPVYISHMSFGALSREIKIALAKGAAMAKTAMCSGEV